MAKLRLFAPGYRVTDASGTLITTGATIDVYVEGTVTRSDSWTDSTGGTTNANPYVVPATGIPAVWVDSTVIYRIIIKTPSGTTLHDLDHVVGIADGDFAAENTTNSSHTDVITLTHTVTNTPAVGLGTTILFKGESADENPSDIGRAGFVFDDVTAGTEDSAFRVFTRAAGAALKKAYDWVVTGIGDYKFTGAPTATRTITLPDADLDLRTTIDDATNNDVTDTFTLTHTTSGTPAAGIGTGILYRAESADENPSNVGRTEFILSDVTAGSEDSTFSIWLRSAGAALQRAYRFIITGAGSYTFTGGATVARTITLPDTDLNLGGVYFAARRTTAQSISNSTTTKIEFATIDLDNKSYWDAVNFRYTPLTAGIYLVVGSASTATAANTQIDVYIYKNGAAITDTGIGAPSTTGLAVDTSIVVSMNGTTDYLELYMRQNSGSAQNTITGAASPKLNIFRIATIG